MAHHTKKKLFHLLNERSRREQREKELREHEKYEALVNDQRRDPLGNDYTRIYPLIDNE